MASAGRGAIEVTDVAVDQIYDEPARRVMLAAGSRACISVPVLGIDGVVVGVISAHYRRQGQHDVDCVSRVATDALLARSHAPSLRIPERTEGAEQPGAPPAALVRLDDSHSRRQRAALERAVARHEQSAVFHETLATLAERHGQSDLATTARHRADENANAASLDRDRLHAFWPVVEPTGRLAPSGESAAPRQ
jgi:hypothetical protein